jgi:putative 4-mercaptohistidine N1-methyltranferase
MAENFYNSERAVAEYLLLHYGKSEPRLPEALSEALDFPARCVSQCLDVGRLPKDARALDLGCAVGRSSFELARHCPQVLALDFSSAFIHVANGLRERGSFTFKYVEEGEIMHSHTAVVPSDLERKRVTFERGDAVNLRLDLGLFDVVLMANLIDRVDDPRKCLEQLPGIIKAEGQLIITSPYTWLAEFTPRENWLGGFISDGHQVQTFDALKDILSPQFELMRRQDLPFMIREHSRKFQYGISEASIWQRRKI